MSLRLGHPNNPGEPVSLKFYRFLDIHVNSHVALVRTHDRQMELEQKFSKADCPQRLSAVNYII